MVEEVRKLFPECVQYRDEMLKVSSVHSIYFEECGNPKGAPVIFLHGGPGSGCNYNQRRFFDPSYYRIILFDQRGCGRSQPQGEVTNNTTDDLISDIESIRHHLGIARWHVFGGSWGSTLGLVYAISHAQTIISLTLRGIFLSRQSEIDWFLNDVKHFHPQAFHDLCAYLPVEKRDNVLISFEELIFSDDIAISAPAAATWNAFEGSMMTLLPRASDANPSEPKTADEITKASLVEVARARVQIHYIKHLCFVGERDLLTAASEKLSRIPTTIVQGSYDMVCPPISAWQLARAMPHATLVMVPDAGHSAMEVGITSALVSATEQYKLLT